MKKFAFNNRPDNLRGSCRKVYSQGRDTSVDITFVNNNYHLYAPIRIKKSELLNSNIKYVKMFEDYDLQLTDEEIKEIITIAKDSLENDEADEQSGKDNIIDIIKDLYKLAKIEGVEETAIIRDKNLYIAAGFLGEFLEKKEWKSLEFKRQLKNLGLLKTNGNRAYDILVNASKTKKYTKKYTCIKLKSDPNDLINIEAAIAELEIA